MRRIVVLSDEDIKDISEGKEVCFEFFEETYALVNEEAYKNFKAGDILIRSFDDEEQEDE